MPLSQPRNIAATNSGPLSLRMNRRILTSFYTPVGRKKTAPFGAALLESLVTYIESLKLGWHIRKQADRLQTTQLLKMILQRNLDISAAL